MDPCRLTVHPVYGAIYRDGEFVQRGAVLGLNTEANGVVIAPASGWVRLVRLPEAQDPRYEGLAVEIWPQSLASEAPVSSAGNPKQQPA